MDISSVFALSFAIGVIAGLRAFTAPAAVSWGGWLGWVDLSGTWAGFLATRAALVILTALALFELFNDKRPSTPSRTAPPQFAARIATGAFAAAALGASGGASAAACAVIGALGAVAGTLGGYEARTRPVSLWHAPDKIVAVIEDAVAVGGGLLIASRLAGV